MFRFLFVFVTVFAVLADFSVASPFDRSTLKEKISKTLTQFKSVALDRMSDQITVKSEVQGCAYNEEEDEIEVSSSTQTLSEAGFTECLAAAMSQARYAKIETSWLAHLGVREAWVIKNGKPARVSVGEKALESAEARNLWVGFAVHELMSQVQTRTLASAPNAVVRKLLEMPH